MATSFFIFFSAAELSGDIFLDGNISEMFFDGESMFGFSKTNAGIKWKSTLPEVATKYSAVALTASKNSFCKKGLADTAEIFFNWKSAFLISVFDSMALLLSSTKADTLLPLIFTLSKEPGSKYLAEKYDSISLVRPLENGKHSIINIFRIVAEIYIKLKIAQMGRSL